MKTSIILAAAFGLLTILTGCGRLTEFSVDESQINSYLTNNVKYDNKISISGIIDADIQLFNLTSEIGRSEPGKVAITGETKISLDSLFGSTKAEIILTLTSSPYFDVNSGSIYLKDLMISSYKVTPQKMDSTVAAVIPYLNSSLQSYFEHQPIYILNPKNSIAEASAKKLAKGLEVKPGKLVIPLIDKSFIKNR